MMKKYLTVFVVLILLLGFSISVSAKTAVVKAVNGASISGYGLAFDASYDERLDLLVPGYKIIDVAVLNGTYNMIYLDPIKDKWTIKLAGSNANVKTTFNLRRDDPVAWEKLPERVKVLLSYPLVLPIGARQVIDIFVPDTVDAKMFNEVSIFIKSLDARFDIVMSR